MTFRCRGSSRRPSQFCFGKSGQNHFGRGMALRVPPRFTATGGGQTRCAQTVPTFSLVPVALLGHATRPGKPKGECE